MSTERRFDAEHTPVWRISDESWERIYSILIEDCPPRKGPGRKPADWRQVVNGIVYRLRTGCHWNKLPKEFGDDSTIHRWYQRWNKNGVMSRILSELRGEWQPVDDVSREHINAAAEQPV
jgi:putative transposase